MDSIIVYWSGTGNTEGIAEEIGKDRRILVKNVSDVTKEEVLACNTIILGCSAMGDEVLEEDEFQPFYDSIKNDLKDKRVLLFGSYGWGDGLWMRNWTEELEELGANVVKSLIVNGGITDCDINDYNDFINSI